MTIKIPLTESLPYSTPSIDCYGQLCEDGLAQYDRIEYVCPKCGYYLFSSKDLNWMEGGYWISPNLTLKKKCYSPEKETVVCPVSWCKEEMNLTFFSYSG
jgi:hypothetical protein